MNRLLTVCGTIVFAAGCFLKPSQTPESLSIQPPTSVDLEIDANADYRVSGTVRTFYPLRDGGTAERLETYTFSLDTPREAVDGPTRFVEPARMDSISSLSTWTDTTQVSVSDPVWSYVMTTMLDYEVTRDSDRLLVTAHGALLLTGDASWSSRGPFPFRGSGSRSIEIVADSTGTIVMRTTRDSVTLRLSGLDPSSPVPLTEIRSDTLSAGSL